MNCMGIYIAMALTGLFIGITFFRMYCRTGMKSHLLISLGSVIGLIGAVGILISYNIGDEKIVDILTQILVIPGTLLIVCGIILISTIESGAAKDALSGHSIFDIILGNISSLEKGKYTPTLSKAGGIIVVTILIIYGIVKCWFGYLFNSYSGIFIIAFVLVIFVISIVPLKREGKKRIGK